MIETSIYVLINSIILIFVHFVYKKTKFNPFIDILIIGILGILLGLHLRPLIGMSTFITYSEIHYFEYINMGLIVLLSIYFFKFIFRDTEDYSKFR